MTLGCSLSGKNTTSASGGVRSNRTSPTILKKRLSSLDSKISKIDCAISVVGWNREKELRLVKQRIKLDEKRKVTRRALKTMIYLQHRRDSRWEMEKTKAVILKD